MPTGSKNKIISINELWQFFNRSCTLFCITGADGYLKHINPHVTELLGFSEEEMLSVPFMKFVHPEDRVETAKQSAAVRKGQRVVQITNRILTANQDHKWISWTATYIENEDNVYLIGQDHTNAHIAEEKLELEKISKQKSILEASVYAQEKERAEIGKELHDNINQMLAMVLLYLQASVEEKELKEEMMRKAANITRNAIAEIRSLSKNLVGPDMKQMGLMDSIKELIQPIKKASGLKISISRSGALEQLPAKLKLMIFRIVQEQMNNIIKHAEAKKVQICLRRSKENLLLEIVDDGKGFDVKKKRNGIGLNNMHSRAELYNGSIEINSAPEKGCSLKVSIPANMIANPVD